MAYYDVYREQLASLYYGHALWEPNPAGLYDQVRIGDVGYVRQGHFLRMFNALLPANHPMQGGYGVPPDFVPLNMGEFGNIRTLHLPRGDHCSSAVVRDSGTGSQIHWQAAGPDEGTHVSFKCRRNKGAFLLLPFNGHREDAIRTKAFETYIRKHCDSWLEFVFANNFDAKLEDIVLVTGCDRTSSWAMAAFVNCPWDTEIPITFQITRNASARFQWPATGQPHNSEPNENTEMTHCVFIRGFRAKRILPFYTKMKAFAEHRPDDPDNEPEPSIELVREPDVPEVDTLAFQHS
ncbi:hypothetical protein B0F90DRAFT_681103 [Multifurca ochricompacta]|uniref:Uncharacterized protein n=1 Tax=Multifurca ochricompacta TaxID=376703 RepID=A0AAD4M3T1_9AGAM|nr:hypothetical protein B0F90DRAFT_681103 [Multifurca ochricompacta]